MKKTEVRSDNFLSESTTDGKEVEKKQEGRVIAEKVTVEEAKRGKIRNKELASVKGNKFEGKNWK